MYGKKCGNTFFFQKKSRLQIRIYTTNGHEHDAVVATVFTIIISLKAQVKISMLVANIIDCEL